MGKIVEFPKQIQHNQTKPRNKEELYKSVEDFRMSYIEDVSEFLLNIIMVETGRAGFELNETDINDVMLIGDSLKSLMMKKNGMHHILQEFSEEYQELLTSDDNSDSVMVDVEE